MTMKECSERCNIADFEDGMGYEPRNGKSLGPRKGREIDSFLDPPEKKCQHLDQTCIRLLTYRT